MGNKKTVRCVINTRLKIPLGLLFCILLISLASITGCVAIMDGAPTIIDHKTALEQKELERGYIVFRARDFENAKEIFSSLQYSKNESISRNAKYALACTKWALANTQAAEQAAFDQWKEECSIGGGGGGGQAKKLLEVLLETLMRGPRKAGQTGTGAHTKSARQCQTQLHLRDKAIGQLKQKIKAMKAENALLKKKLKSIEEIDQRIQKKKADPPPRKRM